MKKIGLIGGMSWESTAFYYRLINTFIRERLGGLHSGKIVLYSVDFAEIEKLQHQGKWDETASILNDAAVNLEKAGADFFLICTNTMHKVAGKVAESVEIPLVHIADATAEVLKKENIKKIGLIGTSFTMKDSFYKGRLKEKFGLEVEVPGQKDMDLIHRVIYDELCKGILLKRSRDEYLRIVNELSDSGCEGVILGCTEIGSLIKSEDTSVKLFDTTLIHAQKAVDLAI